MISYIKSAKSCFLQNINKKHLRRPSASFPESWFPEKNIQNSKSDRRQLKAPERVWNRDFFPLEGRQKQIQYWRYVMVRKFKTERRETRVISFEIRMSVVNFTENFWAWLRFIVLEVSRIFFLPRTLNMISFSYATSAKKCIGITCGRLEHL